MLVSVNPTPPMEDFKSLMEKTNELLNKDAQKRHAHYASLNGTALEDDVKDALKECAKETPFENTIEKISGQQFPDIVAAKYYGVEVKSTQKDRWTSTGSSILESTRVSDVERIFLTFGKLGGNPIEFCSRPYEECLSDIRATHMPRYLIDMRLKQGETIFDKMNTAYDKFRKLPDPIATVADYYKGKGERPWWTGGSVDEAGPASIKLWKSLSDTEKREYTIWACINYPEVFQGNYDEYALWLTTSQGIVDTHIRDQFSSGGKVDMAIAIDNKGKALETAKFPAVFGRVKNNLGVFIDTIKNEEVRTIGQTPIQENCGLNQRISLWIETVANSYETDKETIKKALNILFQDYLKNN